MYRLFCALAAAALFSTACIELERRVTEVPPGTVPPEIRGAHWPELPVRYCIVRDEAGGFVEHDVFVEFTQRAIAAWGVPVEYEGECPGPIEHGNGLNEIGWGSLGADTETLAEAGNAHLRYRTSLVGGVPEITEADVTIERDPAQRHRSEECLYTTILHEAGHLFGIPHLSGESVMSAVISDCHQELTPEDLDAINELY